MRIIEVAVGFSKLTTPADLNFYFRFLENPGTFLDGSVLGSFTSSDLLFLS